MTVAHHPGSHALYHEPALLSDLRLQCPRCSGGLGSLPAIGPNLDAVLACSKCLLRIRSDHGIWRAIPPAREICFERFITEYQIVRQKEGRGSDNPEYFLALPYRDTTGRNQSQWTIRALTFRHFEEKILSKLEQKHPEGMTVLDLGAGNGWLSYHLALRGHRPVAVDLLVNDTDGLGSAVHYRAALRALFPRFQAELDRLPFADSQFDCAIFNASFHYSEDYVPTLQEALRCLRPGGSVIVCDSPWYEDERSGRAMLEERRAAFIAKFGFPSDGMASMEFLTDRMLMRLEHRFGIRWQVQTPYYGIPWSLRPLLARLRGKRDPSRFRIYVAEVKK
jgi:SAM-dependent methyltransferase